eukprot:XP_001703386.1 predicted protein [Chlamydomonas reinhardtii]
MPAPTPACSPSGGASSTLGSITLSDTQPPPLRVVGPNSTIFRVLREQAKVYAATTGVPVVFDLLELTAFVAERGRQLLDPNPPNGTHGFDALLAAPTSFGDADIGGKLTDLTYLVLGDRLLGWAGIQASAKASVMYDGRVSAVPFIPAPQSGAICSRAAPDSWGYRLIAGKYDYLGDGNHATLGKLMLYYHLDAFTRWNLSVPSTWEEYADLAEAHHGREGLFGSCMLIPGCGSESYVLRLIYGSYVQTQGPSHGMYWDPETLEPLVNTPAMEAALKIWRRLRLLNPTDTAPGNCLRRDYVRGRCLLQIQAGTDFKVGSVSPNSTGWTAMRGRMGIALQPGTTHVLDRQTRQLVPCTRERCPYAYGTSVVNGTALPVNRAITTSTNIVLLNGLAPDVYQFYVSVIGTRGLLTLNNEILPARDDDLDPSNVPLWVKAGYDEGDTQRFLRVHRWMARMDNINADLKIRLTTNVTNAMLAAALAYGSPAANITAASASNVMAALEAVLNRIVAAEGGKEGFAAQYRRWEVAPACVQIYATIDEAPPPPSSSSASRALTLGLAIGIPLGVTALAAVVAAAWVMGRRRGWQQRWRRRGGAAVPGAGSSTTLCVTDIESSTLLWEYLPAECMDAALKLHHRVIRQLLLQHSGYESATEGDSFILAFHRPLDALLFAAEAQQALLDAVWPVQLLQHEPLPEVDPQDDPGAEVALLHRPAQRGPRAAGTPRRHTSKRSMSPQVSALAAAAAVAASASTGGPAAAAATANASTASGPATGTGAGAASAGATSLAALLTGQGSVEPNTMGLLQKAMMSNSGGAGGAGGVSGGAGGRPPSADILQLRGSGVLMSRFSGAGLDGSGPLLGIEGSTHGVGCGGGMGPSGAASPMPLMPPPMSALSPRLRRAAATSSSGSPHAPRSSRGGTPTSAGGAAARRRSVGGENGAAAAAAAAATSGGDGPVVSGSGSYRATAGRIISRLGGPLASAIRTSRAFESRPSLDDSEAVAAAANYNDYGSSPVAHAGGGLGGLAHGPLPVALPPPSFASGEITPAQQPGPSLAISAYAAAAEVPGADLRRMKSRSGITAAAARAGGAAAAGANESRVVVFRGLRVRMGLHSGVPSPGDVSRNTASGRVVFSGYPLRLAKAVSDAAHGGMILFSETVREELRVDGEEDGSGSGGGGGGGNSGGGRGSLQGLSVLWMGRHVLGDGLKDMHLFQAVSRGMLGRLALFPPLRTEAIIRPFTGVLQAPVVTGAVARVTVAGASTLLAWDYQLASFALEMMYDAIIAELESYAAVLSQLPGCSTEPYIVEGAFGLAGRSGGAAAAGGAARGKGAAAGGGAAGGRVSEEFAFAGSSAGRGGGVGGGGAGGAGLGAGQAQGRSTCTGSRHSRSSSSFTGSVIDAAAAALHLPSYHHHHPYTQPPPQQQQQQQRQAARLSTESHRRSGGGGAGGASGSAPAALGSKRGSAATASSSLTAAAVGASSSMAFAVQQAPSSAVLTSEAGGLTGELSMVQPDCATVPSASAIFSGKRPTRHGASSGGALAAAKTFSRVTNIGSGLTAAAAAWLGDGAGGGGGTSGGGSGGPGVMTVVFDSAHAAAAWLLLVVDLLPCLDWPAELLSHPLCEDLTFDDAVVVGALDSNADMVALRLQRQQEVRANPQQGAAIAGGTGASTGAGTGAGTGSSSVAAAVQPQPQPQRASSMSKEMQRQEQQQPAAGTAAAAAAIAFGQPHVANVAGAVVAAAAANRTSASGSVSVDIVLPSSAPSALAAPCGASGTALSGATAATRAASGAAIADVTIRNAEDGRGPVGPLAESKLTRPVEEPEPQSQSRQQSSQRTGMAAAADEIAAGATAAVAAAAAAAAAGVGSGGGNTWRAQLPPRSGVVFRGLRAKCAVVYGELGGELPAGLASSGQLAYRGKAWTAAGRVAAKAKAGEVATNAATVALLPPSIAKLVTVKNV